MASLVKPISSRDNPLLAKLRKLGSDPAAYRKLGEVWIEGEHLCSAFLQRGGVPRQAVITEAAWEQPALHEMALQAPAVAVVSPPLMAASSTLESPTSIGFVVPWDGPRSPRPDLPTVVLDRLQDAGNVGTILRTASAFGFSQVIALKGTAALWSPKVLRAGMGAHFKLDLVEAGSVADLDGLKVPLLATSSHAAARLPDVRLPWPCAWVLGHEGQGISDALLERCSERVSIPQPGGEESLNVAIAAAVCLYESLRQRSMAAT
jgi:TrmH family RNA methyltransferase